MQSGNSQEVGKSRSTEGLKILGRQGSPVPEHHGHHPWNHMLRKPVLDPPGHDRGPNRAPCAARILTMQSKQTSGGLRSRPHVLRAEPAGWMVRTGIQARIHRGPLRHGNQDISRVDVLIRPPEWQGQVHPRSSRKQQTDVPRIHLLDHSLDQHPAVRRSTQEGLLPVFSPSGSEAREEGQSQEQPDRTSSRSCCNNQQAQPSQSVAQTQEHPAPIQAQHQGQWRETKGDHARLTRHPAQSNPPRPALPKFRVKAHLPHCL